MTPNLGRALLASLVVAALGTSSGCPSTARVSLTVDVQTGLVPGREFGFVSLELADGARARGVLRDPRTAGAAALLDEASYRTGARIHSFDSLEPGTYTLRVMLRRPASAGAPVDGGPVLIERWATVALSADRIVRVPLTTDCLGVVCPAPAGSPAFAECLNGRCVDPRCQPDEPTSSLYCCDPLDPASDCTDPTLCVTSADCSGRVGCASDECVEGACVERDRAGACPDGTFCARASGRCEPIAPGADAGLDAGPTDAATADAADLDAAFGDASLDAGPRDAGSDAEAPDASPDAWDSCRDVACVLPEVCEGARCVLPSWTLLLPGTGAAHGIARDGGTGIVAVGAFEGDLALPGCATLRAAGGSDIFVVRVSSAGECLWASSFGSAADDEGRDVVVDATGNLYVTGSMGGAIDFGGGALPYSAGTDVFVASFDSTGAHRWSVGRGSFGNDVGHAIELDTSPSPPEVVVTGTALGLFTWLAPLNTGGNHASFVGWVRSDTGAPTFGLAASGPAGSAGRDVTVLSGGIPGQRSPVAVVGDFRGRTDFGRSRTAVGGSDVFIARYSRIGALDWVQTFGGPGDDAGRALASDGTSLYAAGDYRGTVTFTGAPSTATAEADGFVLSLEPTMGTVGWARVFGTAGDDPTTVRNDSGRGLSFGPDGRLWVVGTSSEMIFWAGGSAAGGLPCPGGCESGLLGWLDAANTDGRIRGYPGTLVGFDAFHSVVSDGDRVFAAGEFDGRVRIDATSF